MTGTAPVVTGNYFPIRSETAYVDAKANLALGGTATDATPYVFWAVGSAGLCASSVWMSSILSGVAITLSDSVTLQKFCGLSTAVVTLTNNSIIVP